MSARYQCEASTWRHDAHFATVEVVAAAAVADSDAPEVGGLAMSGLAFSVAPWEHSILQCEVVNLTILCLKKRSLFIF